MAWLLPNVGAQVEQHPPPSSGAANGAADRQVVDGEDHPEDRLLINLVWINGRARTVHQRVTVR
jgi:hypothetical protein